MVLNVTSLVKISNIDQWFYIVKILNTILISDFNIVNNYICIFWISRGCCMNQDTTLIKRRDPFNYVLSKSGYRPNVDKEWHQLIKSHNPLTTLHPNDKV